MGNLLKDKVAIITGAGAGIGRATALLFASEGAKVVVHDINIEGGQETIKLLKDQNREAFFIKADISIEKQVENVINKTIENYKKIDILVNGAGIGSYFKDSVTDMEEEDWNKVININLKGTMLASKYAIREMIKKGKGSIINFSSAYGFVGVPFAAAYCASKGAVNMLTKQMAVEYARYNIRVNAVSPGFIGTRMFYAMVEKNKNPVEAEKILCDMVPIGKIGKPEQVADAVLFFASELSSYITGVIIPVDGGYMANGARRLM